MGTELSGLLEWMTGLSPAWAYAAILAIAYGENVLPPIPGDVAIVFGGYLVGIGRLDFLPVVLLSTLGGAAGFMTMYALGRRIGDAVMDPKRMRWLPKARISDVRDWLGRWGYGVIAANRFLSGARSIISLTVGMARMDAWKTAAFATLSAAVWTVLITYGGYKLGENWHTVVDFLKRYGQVMLALTAVFAVGWAARWLWRRRKANK